MLKVQGPRYKVDVTRYETRGARHKAQQYKIQGANLPAISLTTPCDAPPDSDTVQYTTVS
jgi:hypothetical protein